MSNPKKKLSLSELITKKVSALAKDDGGSVGVMLTRRSPKSTESADRFNRLKAEFIERTGIPVDEINRHAYDDDEEEINPFEFKLDWIGPYAPMIYTVAGAEGDFDHITLAKAIQATRKCRAYHVNYAAVPTREKIGYGNRLKRHFMANVRYLPDEGILLAVTAKMGFTPGVQGSDYVNVPRAISFYSSTVMVPGDPSRLYFNFNLTKARMHRPRVIGRVSKADVLQAAEIGIVDDFDFQEF